MKKLIDVGLTLATGAWPLPESEMESGELVALLVTASAPEARPGVTGVKVRLSVWLWLGLSVVVPAKPLATKGPLVCTVLTVIAVVPEFVSVRV